ncbi:MAG: transposase [Candidatus Sabulitectum sp.]|nr:transposase [Candidatus Sabulitectum sp.]
MKDNRDTFYGHKICLTAGKSSLVFDCTVFEGNPADSTLAVEMIRRLKEKCGTVPEKVAMDGGFASKKNVKELKNYGVDEVFFQRSAV